MSTPTLMDGDGMSRDESCVGPKDSLSQHSFPSSGSQIPSAPLFTMFPEP